MSALVLLKDLDGVLEGSPVAALAGHVAAPHLGLHTCLGQVDERAALPEAALNVRDKAFGMRLISRPTHPGWICQKAACLTVLQKPARQARCQCVRSGDRGRKVVDDQALRDAPE